jgi:hypothetical protein
MPRPPSLAILVAITSLGVALAATPSRAQSESVIASDNFNRADEVPFAPVGNWGRVVAGNYDGFSTLTNSRVNSATNEGIYYWNGPGTFSTTRQFARERVVDRLGEMGLVLLGGPDQAILVGWGPPGGATGVFIYWYAGGQDQGVLATGPSTLNNGDVIEAVLEGGVISAKVNGVTVKSVANTTTLTTGKPGFITYANPNFPTLVGSLDDWEAGIPTSYTIGGTITENAAGLSGVVVTASGGFSGGATTDVNGAYSIPGVPADATGVVLTPNLAGHTMSPLTRTVVGPVTGNVTGQDFTSTLSTSAVLTIVASHGSVTRDPDQPTYPFGTQVALTPLPDAGYSFAGWSGDVPAGHETDNPLIVTMSADRTITAVFSAPNAASDDFNRADETPFAVGGNWQQPFGPGNANLVGSQVAGANGEALYYWQGGATFDDTRQFARSRVVSAGGQVGLVLLGASGQALVTAWHDGTLYIYWYSSGSYRGNLTTTPSTLHDGDGIEAQLAGGKVYAKINGAVVLSVANTTSLTSGRPGFETFQAGATFDDWEAGTPPAYAISGTITENAAGRSGVLVTAGGGFSGSATTNASGVYSIGGVPADVTSPIVLTPTLAGHTMSPLTRTIPAPVTADVTGQDFVTAVSTSLVLTTLGSHGSITRSPDQPTYAFGTQVTLTPVADGGYAFAAWTGDVPAGHATDNPLLVTMDEDRTITATFLPPNTTAAESFDRPDETPFAVGGNWQQPFGGGHVNLTGQQIVGVTGEALYYWQGSGSFDNTRQFARATVVDAGGQVGLVLLGGGGQALVTAWHDGTLYIYWYSSGSYRGNLITTPSTLQNGDVIEADLIDGTVYAKINGAVVLSVANTTTLTSGRPGFETYQGGATLDNWEAGTPPLPSPVPIFPYVTSHESAGEVATVDRDTGH